MSLGYLADPIGRERTLAIACVVFIIGAILQATSYSIVQIVSYSPKPDSHLYSSRTHQPRPSAE